MEVKDTKHAGHDVIHGHEHEHHEHNQTFWTKYVFSTDHKMISKQFLITAIFMAFLAMGMSMLFRIQLAWPDQTLPFLENIIGKWGKDGKLDPGSYVALVTIHGTIMIFIDRKR